MQRIPFRESFFDATFVRETVRLSDERRALGDSLLPTAYGIGDRVDALMRGCADASQVSPAATDPVLIARSARSRCARLKNAPKAHPGKHSFEVTFRWTVTGAPKGRKIEWQMRRNLGSTAESARWCFRAREVLSFRKKLCACGAFYLPPPTEAPSFKRGLIRWRLRRIKKAAQRVRCLGSPERCAKTHFIFASFLQRFRVKPGMTGKGLMRASAHPRTHAPTH